MSPDVPHLQVPLALDATGGLAVVEQDELPDVRQSVQVLLLTPLGARPLAPEVGVEDPTFSAGVDTDALARTVAEQEPRADVTVTAEPVGETGEQQVQIAVALANDPVEDA